MKRPVSVMAVLVLIGLAIAASSGSAQQANDDGSFSATIPEVTLTVYRYEDPYQGNLISPEEPDPARRYIGIDIGVKNFSSFPVQLPTSSIRLRDELGQEYQPGGATGDDLRLNGRTLAALDQARGWVWFSVPADAQIVQIVYIPSTLEIRIEPANLPPATPRPLGG